MLNPIFRLRHHLLILACSLAPSISLPAMAETAPSGTSATAPIDTELLSSVPQYITFRAIGSSDRSFCIADGRGAATLCVDAADWRGVIRAAQDLGADIGRVTGTTATVETITVATAAPHHAILVGTIGHSPLIDALIAQGRLNVEGIRGEWESFVIETIDDCLVIAGSDKRGTIYGLYDVSEKIGVSPWYWWADVPVRHSPTLYVKAGRYVQSSPKVKYRGIFINDEWPSFGNWTSKKFGGFNSQMYAHLFELLLRLKANYLWPAMWSAAFNEDDPLNPQVADEYGIVMGTSHHEPMMRAHQEYTRRRDEVGPWDYASNATRLDTFFSQGLRRNHNFENMITIGMRGDGDVAMGNGNDADNMQTLHDVIDSQRAIIRDVYGRDPEQVPQLWAIFTEVQRYYDKGFSVPDDVLLLFCDNNWGYIRRTGPDREKQRSGGMGMYYHIDMNGGPWNDRWVNTTTIPKLREQFHLAYATGIDDLWVVNVGDLKPKELPIDFILRYAWNPEAIGATQTEAYTRQWAAACFGAEHAPAIASVLSRYPKYNLWRKAEVQATDIYSQTNYREAERVRSLWQVVAAEADSVARLLPAEMHDAYYELVQYPATASAGVAEIYLDAAAYQWYARHGAWAVANRQAVHADSLFAIDQNLSRHYNEKTAAGKWQDMMSDKHIGYTKWSMPEANRLPDMPKLECPSSKPEMGVMVESEPLGNQERALQLPDFDSSHPEQAYYIEVFNRGGGELPFRLKADSKWIKINRRKGVLKTADRTERIEIKIDWAQLREGRHTATVSVVSHAADATTATVGITAVKQTLPTEISAGCHGNLTGAEIGIEAHHYSENRPTPIAQWTVLPDMGRGEACMAIHPVTAPSILPAWGSADSLPAALQARKIKQEAPCLSYEVYLSETGETPLCLGIMPTQDVDPMRGLRLAVALDDEAPVVLDARQGFVDTFNEYTPQNLKQSTTLRPLPQQDRQTRLIGAGQARRNEIFDDLRWLSLSLPVTHAGMHTLRVYMIDPEIVLQKIVIRPDNAHPSYFGAPERPMTATYRP